MNTKKDWFCYQCSLQFDSQHAYSLHLKLIHKYILETKNKLRLHELHASKEKSDLSNQIVADKNEKKTFECEICQYSSYRRDHLDRHVASIHEGKRPFKCEFCNHTFSLKDSLNSHIASVHEGKKPLKCEICNYTFLERMTFPNMLLQFMKKRSHSNVSFVAILLLQRLT